MTVPTTLKQEQADQIGRLSYGEFIFPVGTRTKMDVKPVYDQSKQYLIGYDIEVKADFLISLEDKNAVLSDTWATLGQGGNWVQASIDGAINELRYLLLEPGRDLAIIDKGLAPLYISNDGKIIPGTGFLGILETGTPSRRDQLGGPYPDEKGLSLTPITNKAIKGTWVCKARILPCEDHTSQFGIHGVAFSTQYSFTTNGALIRTINGVMHTSVPRFRGSNPPDEKSPLDLRGEIEKLFPRLTKFNRQWANFSEDQKKSKVTFSLVDREIQSENPYPPGLTKFKPRYRAYFSRGEEGLGVHTWKMSLSAEIEVAPDVPKWTAWIRFLQLYLDLVDISRRNQASINFLEGALDTIDGELSTVQNTSVGKTKKALDEEYAYRRENYTPPTPPPSPARVIIQSVDIDDTRDNREATISIEWFLISCNFSTLLNATGLFHQSTPRLEFDNENNVWTWSGWANSMSIGDSRTQSAEGPPLSLNSPDRYDVALCPVQDSLSVSLPDEISIANSILSSDFDSNDPAISPSQETNPETDNSYVVFDNRLEIVEDWPVTENIPLDTDKYPTLSESITNTPPYGDTQISNEPGSQDGGKTWRAAPTAENSTGSAEPENTETFVQGEPHRKAIMRGYAMRIGKPPLVPALFKVGGQSVIPAAKQQLSRGTATERGALFEDVVIHYAYWVKRYIIKGVPKDNTIESNALLNIRK